MEIDKQKKKEMFFEITDSLTSLELAEYTKEFKERYGIKEETVVSATTPQVEEQKKAVDTANVSLKILEVSGEIKKAIHVYKVVQKIVNSNVPGKHINTLGAKNMFDEGKGSLILENIPESKAKEYKKEIEEDKDNPQAAKVEIIKVK